jgi:superfamily I DNA and/or RNA helicase
LHAGEKYHERRKGTSYMNVGEAQIVEEQVRALIESGLSPDKIGVITPYKGQVEHIRDRLGKFRHLLNLLLFIFR